LAQMTEINPKLDVVWDPRTPASHDAKAAGRHGHHPATCSSLKTSGPTHACCKVHAANHKYVMSITHNHNAIEFTGSSSASPPPVGISGKPNLVRTQALLVISLAIVAVVKTYTTRKSTGVGGGEGCDR